MSSGESTGFRIYSLGIVTEDKTDDDGDYIKVTPVEELPLLKGRLNDISIDLNVQGKDHRGVDVKADVKGVGYVVAKWIAFIGDNRMTAPNVVEGETVLLWKFAATQELYWTEFERAPGLRRLENVIRAYSNIQEKGDAFDLDSSYWVQWNTRDQIVKLHTSKNRNEPVAYDVTLDTGKGTFQLVDSNNNEIFLDSVNGDLRFNTNTSVEINTKQVRINAEEYVHITTKELVEKADTISNQASQSHEIKSDGSATSQAEGQQTVKGAQTTIQGDSPVVIHPGIAVS